ncbi:MAG: hypothetical protein P9X24_08810 [Candidatus Hatepunaea meridiana]|nr:hypothetical protein [Candidatus Hatepunaea meridiana]
MKESNPHNRGTRSRFGYKPDTQLDDVWIDVKLKPNGFRNLRSSFLGLASWIVDYPEESGLLVLVDPRFSKSRLSEEWQLAKQSLHPEVVTRLHLVVVIDNHCTGLPEHLGNEFRERLDKFVMEEFNRKHSYHSSNDIGHRRPQSFYDIFKVILNLWLLDKGPVTTKWLMEATGCSYPTVARALNRLEYCLQRHRNRQIELRYFPKEEWARIIANIGEIQLTARFADRSGQPRSPEAHLNRLKQLSFDNIAIGGVLGAKYYNPDLDLIGTPRLDISMHSVTKLVDHNFIKKLDPALKEVIDPLYPVNVVVHIVSITDPLFRVDTGGFKWADPVQCLLDLHEARLESQAIELREFLQSKRSSRS